jgi:hypothetical protein
VVVRRHGFGYVAAAIRKKAKKLKHEVPIKPVERPHCKKPPVWTEAQKQRFKIRTIVEQQSGTTKWTAER